MSTATKTTASTGTKKPTTRTSTVTKAKAKKADAIMEQMLEIPSFANNEFTTQYATAVRIKRKKTVMSKATILLFIISILLFVGSVVSVLYASSLIRGM